LCSILQKWQDSVKKFVHYKEAKVSKHQWKEHRFENNGFFQKQYTCLQIWRCAKCNLTIDLPLGVTPGDYDTTICKGDSNVYRTNPDKVLEVRELERMPNGKHNNQRNKRV
jgi:hypothetical protein